MQWFNCRIFCCCIYLYWPKLHWVVVSSDWNCCSFRIPLPLYINNTSLNTHNWWPVRASVKDKGITISKWVISAAGCLRIDRLRLNAGHTEASCCELGRRTFSLHVHCYRCACCCCCCKWQAAIVVAVLWWAFHISNANTHIHTHIVTQVTSAGLEHAHARL